MILPSSKSVLICRLCEFHKSDLPGTELLEKITIGLNRLFVEHVLDAGGWRQFDGNLVGLKVF